MFPVSEFFTSSSLFSFKGVSAGASASEAAVDIGVVDFEPAWLSESSS